MNVPATRDPLSEEALGLSRENLRELSADALLEWADWRFGDGLAMTTSFGIQSAVTLHLATRVRPDLPVIWIDTGYLPELTYRYADQLIERLDLNVRVYRSELSPREMESRLGRLWESGSVEELNLYDWIRKVEPLRRAMDDINPAAWITGIRAEQTDFRRSAGRVSFDGTRHKLAPILNWSAREVFHYMQRNGLPQHPLWAEGYTTVGDWHSSRPLASADANDRATRFGGLKQECGIHLP